MSIITLTTDLGQNDYTVAVGKGKLLSVNPGIQIIDVTHQLAAFNYNVANYICRSIVNNFPANSYHLILFDLFDKKPEQLLVVQHQQQYIICADNGLHTMITDNAPEIVWGIPINSVFNVIDYFAVMGKTLQLLLQGVAMSSIGIPNPPCTIKNPLQPSWGNDYIIGQIIYIDRFDNVIVNITQKQFEEQRKNRNFKISFKRNEHITHISNYYGEVPVNEKVAYFNSAGYLEIAINKAMASQLFGLLRFSDELSPDAPTATGNRFFSNVRVEFFSSEAN